VGAALALIAAGLAIAFALWPLLKRAATSAAGLAELGELANQRDLAIQDLRDIDFDRDLGNLLPEDHQALQTQAKRRAVDILRQLNEREERLDAEIENAVSRLRSGPNGA
jgi:hypothetical protein